MPTGESTQDAVDGRAGRSLLEDDRAIEGLPIRLVIALVVGVAALALMLNILGGIGTVGDTEVTVELDDSIIEDDDPATVVASVIDENGNNVEGATVIVSADSAQLDGVVTAETGSGSESHEAELSFDADDHGLRADQDMGTLEIDIDPPSDSNYIDEQPNPDITVVTEES